MSDSKKAIKPVEPTRYDYNKAFGDNELDSYVGYDIQTGVYYDIFGKTITEDEADARRELKAQRMAEAEAERQRVLEEMQKKAEAEKQRVLEEKQSEAEKEQKPNNIGVALEAFCKGLRGESIK
ncbi:MAG: hypothetical protein ACPIA7_01250 [Akkermansiaceae bacterium]